MPITITHSSMGRFLACPRAWYLSDYRRLTPRKKRQDGPLPFGIRVHTALELWGTGVVEAPVDAWNDLMAEDYTRSSEMGFDNDRLASESKMGYAMLGNFPSWLDESGFWADYELFKVEQKMRDIWTINVDDEPVDIVFQGKSDVIMRDKSTGNYKVMDWKTTAAVNEATLTVLAKSPQFPGYAILAQQTYPDLIIDGAVPVLLRKVMQAKASAVPFYARFRIPITPTVLAAYERRMITIARMMLDATTKLDNGAHPDDVVPFLPSQLNCKSCEFRAPCDLMVSYPAGAVDMLAEEYVEHDPLARYASGQDDETVLN